MHFYSVFCTAALVSQETSENPTSATLGVKGLQWLLAVVVNEYGERDLRFLVSPTSTASQTNQFEIGNFNVNLTGGTNLIVSGGYAIIASGSWFSGSGQGLTGIPGSAIEGGVDGQKIFSGSFSANSFSSLVKFVESP